MIFWLNVKGTYLANCKIIHVTKLAYMRKKPRKCINMVTALIEYIDLAGIIHVWSCYSGSQSHEC